MHYLDALNEAQKGAVLQKDGPLLIVAGAGAGKTKTITYRILHLIKEGVTPERILAVTFTNKAAKEMRDRVLALLKEDTDLNLPISHVGNPLVVTFHSLCVRILKENAVRLSIPRRFAIYDRDDSGKAIKEALQTLGFDVKEFDPRGLLSRISKEKGAGVGVIAYAEKEHQNNQEVFLARVWEEYEKILRRDKALDFDDLLLRVVEMLEADEELRDHYGRAWSYVHVDEYQDTNKIQYRLARLLASVHRNLCVVGDSDQSIYSWRGADIGNILSFEKHFPDAKVLYLEQNYRSTQTIVRASNEVIAKNKRRKDKTVFTENALGERIGLFGAVDEVDEARFVTQKTTELLREGVSGNEIAVLYRTNFQSRVLEEAFLAAGLPYQIVGTRFFERREVKDVLAFLRAALDDTRTPDLARIMNVPPRGIGKVTLLKVLAGKRDELPGGVRIKVDSFYAILSNIREFALTHPPSETLRFLIKRSGIETALLDGSPEDEERLLNVQELATIARSYDMLSPEEGLEKLLEDAALASDQDEMKDETSAVTLMTVHAAKGLEFSYVFVTGLEEGLFPHERREAEADDEEERRLFYVALTRAKKKVFLSFASTRTIFGSHEFQIPSDFLADLPADLIEAEEHTASERIITLD